MKFCLPILLFFSTQFAFTQITQGKIEYSIQLYDEENEAGGAVQVVENSEMILHFSNDNTHTKVKLGPDYEISTILNKSEQKGALIMTGMMGDIAIMGSYAEISGSEKKVEIEIEYFDQKKEILGYDCKKAKVYYTNGAFGTYWYTEKIKFNKEGIENMHLILPGTPLEYKIESDGSIVTFTAESITELADLDIKPLLTTTPPEGCKIISFAEFQEKGF